MTVWHGWARTEIWFGDLTKIGEALQASSCWQLRGTRRAGALVILWLIER